ncbi:MAG: Ig-like domain-containing protein [Methanobrevibacter sp.]|nr:Ig-like domain-containing protein [Methanobrevibacter sp.]
MLSKRMLFLILLVFICFNIAVVSANDLNSTEDLELNNESAIELEDETAVLNDGNGSDDDVTVEKTTPSITISSDNVKSKDTLEIYLKNSTGSPLKSKAFTAVINNKEYSLKTNLEGYSKINIDLPAKTYRLDVVFNGDDEYNNVSKTFNIIVSKLNTKFTESANFILKNNYLYLTLTDSNGNPVSGKKVTIKVNGKKYTRKTNSNGKVSVKIKSSKSKNSVKASFDGDNQFKSSSKKFNVYVIKKSLSINIANSKFLTNGFIRVYLKSSGKALSKKRVTVYVGGKKFALKTSSEGIVVFKPMVNEGHYTVKAKYGKYYSAKYLKCYEGNVKDPLEENITYKNGKPDIDLMPGNYVMGDGNAKYTLKKSQYREVLKRDSYCLFLFNKLTKYTFFKTKSHPNLYHIIKREKWNVIERAINAKMVKKNKAGYWPGKISVSLKGKSYKYPLVRDAQDNGHTCGPTSCSMCSQALKNYVCERYLAMLSKTNRYGTNCDAMIKALKKNNFVATYFYNSSFGKALNEVKKGGAALIFHAYNHYVSILDISKNGKKVLVSNSYGTYDNIPTGWVKVSYMKKKFSNIDESLIVKLNYKLSDSMINSISCYYTSMGKNWVAQNTHQSIGRV